MKYFGIYLILCVSLLNVNFTNGQHIEICDNTLAYLLYDSEPPFWYIQLNGKIETLEKDSIHCVGIDSYAMIYEIFDKSTYLYEDLKEKIKDKISITNPELQVEILLNTFQNMPKFKSFENQVMVQRSLVTDEKIWLIFEAEEKRRNSTNIENYFHVLTITGKNILCLSFCQFSDQTYEETYFFLNKVISTYKEISDSIEMSNICEIIQLDLPVSKEDLINSLFEKGKNYVNQNEFEEAINVYNQILKMSPENKQALYMRAVSNFNLLRYKETLADLKFLVKNFPSEPKYLLLKVKTHYFMGNLPLAQEQVKKLTKKFPDYYEGWYIYGRIMKDQYSFKEAIKYLEKAIDCSGNKYPEANVVLGNIYLYKNKMDLALEQYNMALKADSLYAWAYTCLAQLRINYKDTIGAITYLNDALKCGRHDMSLLNRVNDLYARIGYFDKARSNFESILSSNPHSYDALHGLGLVSLQQKDYEDALYYYDLLTEYYPDYSEPMFYRGLTLVYLGNRDEGRELIRQSAKLGNPEARDYLYGWFNITIESLRILYEIYDFGTELNQGK